MQRPVCACGCREWLLCTATSVLRPRTARLLGAHQLERHAEEAYARVPDNETVRQRLEGAYRSGEDWSGLVAMLTTVAAGVEDPTARVKLLREMVKTRLHRARLALKSLFEQELGVHAAEELA